jgi:hypothetical protein
MPTSKTNVKLFLEKTVAYNFVCQFVYNSIYVVHIRKLFRTNVGATVIMSLTHFMIVLMRKSKVQVGPSSLMTHESHSNSIGREQKRPGKAMGKECRSFVLDTSSDHR